MKIYSLNLLQVITKYLKPIPGAFNEPQLLQFGQAARYINLTKEEKNMISSKTKARWDYYAVIDGAKIMGREEGAYKKTVEIAKALLAKNTDLRIIAEVTGLGQEEIHSLQ